MLSVDWFIEPPMDFEQKNYLLLDYVQQIDNSFKVQKLSPYILHTEKIVEEMNRFKENRLNIQNINQIAPTGIRTETDSIINDEHYGEIGHLSLAMYFYKKIKSNK
jgi:hypothetical protein